MTGPRPSARRTRASAVRLDDSGLTLGGRSVPLRAGAVHYFSLDPEAWPAVLEAARALGMTAIEVAVPWAVHELKPRRYDFGREPQRNLGRFLGLVREAGLYALLRPGPFVDAELDRAGVPARIAADARFVACDREGHPLLAVSPPRMFAVPSLASRMFREAVSHWLEAVSETVALHCWPDGPVVSIELDAVAPLFSADAPWNTDHHPDALAAYRRMLRRRYRTLARLREAHGDAGLTWQSASPALGLVAEAPDARRRHADALRARDEAAREALDGWMRIFGRGPLARLARTTRAPGREPIGAGQRIELGGAPWRTPRPDARGTADALDACARGVRTLRFRMLVDTPRWIGAPIDARGRRRAGSEALSRLLRELAAEDDAC